MTVQRNEILGRRQGASLLSKTGVIMLKLCVYAERGLFPGIFLVYIGVFDRTINFIIH